MATLRPSHTGLLAEPSRELLFRLAAREWMPNFYLAGSAALTLYLGHRRVRDLDLMGWGRLTSPRRRDLLRDVLEIEPETTVETAQDGFLYLRFAGERSGDAGVRLFFYPYPLVDAEQEALGVAIASSMDLGLMKLAAIISRGSRRDFVDLYLLCREHPLAELLARAAEKFGHVRDFPLQALKGLADLSTARGEPMPELEIDVRWSEVEAWVKNDVRALARQHIGWKP